MVGKTMAAQPKSNRATAQDEYDFARSRFIQSLLTGADITRIVDEASKKRETLRVEIEHLRVLARARHETSTNDARAYQTMLPHRITAAGLQPPSPLEKIGATFGSERMYKKAFNSAKEYVEARDLFVKRRDQLTVVEENLRKTLHAREAAIERQLESAGGHDMALKRDPLLNSAYQKLIALEDDLEHTPVVQSADIP
jgi:hypothetical protein